MPRKDFHAFFSHSWGENEETHKLVRKVASALQERHNLKVWLDSNQLYVGEGGRQFKDGINRSWTFVAFVDKSYVKKVDDPTSLYCRFEFLHMKATKSAKQVITVYLDEEFVGGKNLGTELSKFISSNSATYALFNRSRVEINKLADFLNSVIQAQMSRCGNCRETGHKINQCPKPKLLKEKPKEVSRDKASNTPKEGKFEDGCSNISVLTDGSIEGCEEKEENTKQSTKK